MKLAVVGTGYVGLVSGVCFAEVGHIVTCIDKDLEIINRLRAGEMTIHEPHLEEMVRRNLNAGRLHFTSSLADGVAGAEVVFIAVGTPPLEDGMSDLSYIRGAAAEIGRALSSGYTVVATMSTVPVGTAIEVEAIIEENKRNDSEPIDSEVASNPEFLREGAAVADRMNPHRIVIGVNSQRAADIMHQVYAPYRAPIRITSRSTAELAKYACNAFLATKISFINEIANICELVEADVEQIAKIMGGDPRIGSEFLKAGVGYGGSCFPKDTRALSQIAHTQGHDFALLKAVIEVNNAQKERFIEKMRQVVGEFQDKTIGILGLAFKPNTDDVRESAALEIIKMLVHEGAMVKAYDPVASEKARVSLGNKVRFTVCADPYEVAADADVLAIVTDWDEFKDLDLSVLKSVMKRPVICDGRNLYSTEGMAEAQIEYYSVGRPKENKVHVVSADHSV